MTASSEDLLDSLRTLKPLADERLIAGIHSEGPFLSHARCGAQNPRSTHQRSVLPVNPR